MRTKDANEQENILDYRLLTIGARREKNPTRYAHTT